MVYNTCLTICAYSPITGGAKAAIHNTKQSFAIVQNSASIVKIANESDKMRFSYAFTLALANTSKTKTLVTVHTTYKENQKNIKRLQILHIYILFKYIYFI